MIVFVSKKKCFIGVLFIIGWLIGGWLPAINASATDDVDRIVAFVNDDIILLSELDSMVQLYEKEIKSQNYSANKQEMLLYKMRMELLNQLINKMIADQEISKYGIKVSEREIENAIERIKEANLLTDEKLRNELKKDGMTYEDYKQSIKEQLLRNKLVSYQVESKIIITNEDIKKYYDSNRSEFSGEKKWHLRNILVSVPAGVGKEEKANIYKKMLEIQKKIKNGEAFSKMAQQYSQSPSAANGGDIGEISDSSLSHQIKKALDGVEVKHMTDILDTDLGYQIFYIEDVFGEEGRDLDSAASEIKEKLYSKIVNERYKAWLDDLREKSHIKIVQ